ncbi:hypothetical protein [Marinagarivorans algicola]|uniref:hypothetical protein n=1 Tax=Marinagarivorans algicola TaxID=1513270 RepID=UPI003735CADE
MKPFEHVLSGFCCEVTPRGAYIWKFTYPLFDRFDCLSFLYSQRLEHPEGYIDFEKVDKKELADEFLSRIDKYVENAYQYLTLDQFCLLYEQRPDLLKHERAEMALGYTMVLLGEKDLAVNANVKLTHLCQSKIDPPEANWLLNFQQGSLHDYSGDLCEHPRFTQARARYPSYRSQAQLIA